MFSDPKDDNFCVSFAINFYLRCPVGLRSAAKDCAAEYFAAPGLGKMQFLSGKSGKTWLVISEIQPSVTIQFGKCVFSILNEYHPMMEKVRMKLQKVALFWVHLPVYVEPLAGNHEVYQSSAGMLVTLKLIK